MEISCNSSCLVCGIVPPAYQFCTVLVVTPSILANLSWESPNFSLISLVSIPFIMSTLVMPCSFMTIDCAKNFVVTFAFHEIFRTFADVKQRKTKGQAKAIQM